MPAKVRDSLQTQMRVAKAFHCIFCKEQQKLVGAANASAFFRVLEGVMRADWPLV